MNPPIRHVDPGELRLPPSRSAERIYGSCISKFDDSERSKRGLPPLLVYEDPDGLLEIVDGVTRAVRIAKLAPGELVPVVVIGQYRRSRSRSLRVKDRL